MLTSHASGLRPAGRDGCVGENVDGVLVIVEASATGPREDTMSQMLDATGHDARLPHWGPAAQ